MFRARAPIGSRLYVFSDGLFEFELAGRPEMYSFEAFVKLILKWRERSGGRELGHILESVQGLQGRPNFDDDCALVELEFRQPMQSEAVA